MEIYPDNKSFKVSTREPFGKLLLELMHGQSHDPAIFAVQKHVGAILLSAYIDDTVEDKDNYEHPSRGIIDQDIAKDITLKVYSYANNNNIDMVFGEQYFEGLERISAREAKDLPELFAEREVVAVAAELGYVDRFGFFIGDQDIEMVDEEIEQAQASIEVLELLKKYRGKAKS